MVTRTDYLRSMLEQALDSHNTIRHLQDKPGDLVTIRQELLRAKGILQVIVGRVDPRDHPSVDIGGLASRAALFLDSYYFEREMDIMEPLYGDDPGRLRHMRLTILAALEDRGLIAKIKEVLAEL